MKRKAASVKGKILQKARKEGKDYNHLCLKYMQERFLARLSASPYSSNFALKGALLFTAYGFSEIRPTKDVDVEGLNISNELASIENVIVQILSVELNDGVEFIPESIELNTITDDAEYNGVRVTSDVLVGGDGFKFQLDIGFGDVMMQKPEIHSYPTLFEDEPIKIYGYDFETSFAEKLQTMVDLGMFNSRMKDFYDLWFLIHHHTFSKTRLKKAIQATFSARNTSLDAVGLLKEASFRNDADKANQWDVFKRRMKLENAVRFSEVVEEINEFVTEL